MESYSASFQDFVQTISFKPELAVLRTLMTKARQPYWSGDYESREMLIASISWFYEVIPSAMARENTILISIIISNTTKIDITRVKVIDRAENFLLLVFSLEIFFMSLLSCKTFFCRSASVARLIFFISLLCLGLPYFLEWRRRHLFFTRPYSVWHWHYPPPNTPPKSSQTFLFWLLSSTFSPVAPSTPPRSSSSQFSLVSYRQKFLLTPPTSFSSTFSSSLPRLFRSPLLSALARDPSKSLSTPCHSSETQRRITRPSSYSDHRQSPPRIIFKHFSSFFSVRSRLLFASAALRNLTRTVFSQLPLQFKSSPALSFFGSRFLFFISCFYYLSTISAIWLVVTFLVLYLHVPAQLKQSKARLAHRVHAIY